MEHPICYEVDFGPRKPSSLRKAVKYAIWDDNKEDFLRLIQDPEFQDSGSGWDFSATYILRHDCVNITDALIKGQYNGLIDHCAWWFPGNNELYPDILDRFVDDCPGPKLIKYFLERGCSVVESTTPNQWSTFHLAVNKLYNECECEPSDWNPEMPLFFLIQWLCRPSGRHGLEAVRLLVQNTQNKELVRKVIIDYAEDGQIVHLAALFLAVPELFLSSDFVSLGGRLLRPIPLDEEDTRILESLALLFDVIAMVGDKLVAYTRLDVSNNGCPNQLDLELDFLLREVARHKQGVSADDYIRRISTSFDRKDEDRLNNAIEKKLSSLPTLHKGCFEVFTKMSKKCEVILPKSPPPWFPPPWGKIVQPCVHSYTTGEASANITFDTKIIPANNRMNKMTELIKFRRLASRVNASYIHTFAKRIVK